MPKPLRWLLSLIFILQMYLAMALMALAFAIPAILSRDMAFVAVHSFCAWVRFTAAILLGLRSEIRGPVPQGEVIIAAKHQSFFDIILLVSVLPRPKFIMKRELLWPAVPRFAAPPSPDSHPGPAPEIRVARPAGRPSRATFP